MLFCRKISFFCLFFASALAVNVCCASEFPDPIHSVPAATQSTSSPARADQDTSPTPDAEGVYRSNLPGVIAPKLVHSVDPKYPFRARFERKAGMTVIGLIVDKQGKPQSIHVMSTFSDISAQEEGLANSFDESAMKAIAKYRFEPASYNGKPVSVRLVVEVNFRIY